MKEKLFTLLNNVISTDRIRKHAEAIHGLEGDESYTHYKASTDYVMKMLEDAGFEEIERIALPADGKTAYFDCVMPQAWATAGRSFIRLEDETMPMEERFIADSEKDPFNIGMWSAPTPENGIDCEITDFRSTGKKADAVCGKLVLMDGFSQEQYKFLALNGAAGVIISDSGAVEDFPDFCRWCNAIGYTGWYLTAEDKRVPVFSISPRRCSFLRRRLAQGKLMAHAEAKCRVYDGEIYTVTGVIPGKTAKEITMAAHMYEPFLPDDAAGCAVIAEICRSLKTLISQKQLPPLQKTLRVVLSMERYGYSQYFLDRRRNSKTLVFFSFDSCCHIPGKGQPELKIRLSSMLQPTFIDLYLPDLVRKVLPGRFSVTEKGSLSDDTFCSDDSIGIPSLWMHVFNPRYHHNSGPMFKNADWDLAHDVAAVMGTLIAKLAAGKYEDFRKINEKCGTLAVSAMKDKCTMIRLELEEGRLSPSDAVEKVRFYRDKILKQLASIRDCQSGLSSSETNEKIRAMARNTIRGFHVPGGHCELFGIQAEAARITASRLVPGTLMSLIRVPHAERHNVDIPDLLYMLFDGKRTVRQAIKLFEYENDVIFSAEQYQKTMEELRYLEKYGYVKLSFPADFSPLTPYPKRVKTR